MIYCHFYRLRLTKLAFFYMYICPAAFFSYHLNKLSTQARNGKKRGSPARTCSKIGTAQDIYKKNIKFKRFRLHNLSVINYWFNSCMSVATTYNKKSHSNIKYNITSSARFGRKLVNICPAPPCGGSPARRYPPKGVAAAQDMFTPFRREG